MQLLVRDLELQLILACGRPDPSPERIRALVDAAPDWQKIVRISDAAHVVPLVYVRLREAVPLDAEAVPRHVYARLRGLYHRSAALGVLRRHLLRRVLERLSEARIPVVVLGDAVLATRVYSSPTLRPVLGLDLLVHPHDRHRVNLVLRDMPRAELTLHDELFGLPATLDAIFDQAQPDQFETSSALMCSPEDLVLQLAAHLGQKLGEPDAEVTQLATIFDIAATCHTCASDFDWPRFVQDAHAYLAGARVHAALQLAADVTDTHVPAAYLAKLRPTPPLVQSSSSPGELAVTYDNSSSDGVGSQLQRIYALYALSRTLHVKYVHTPLGRVGYQGLMPLLTGQTQPDFAARFNAAFSLPSDDFCTPAAERIEIHTLTERVVERYRRRTVDTRQSVLLSACIPFPCTDRHPSSYLVLRSVSPYRDYRPQGPIRVCVHLRRGDNSVSGRADHGDRLLPNSFYLRVCQMLVDALHQHGVPLVIRMHTEIPPRAYTLEPGDPGLYFHLDRPGTINPADYALDDFAHLPNLEIVANVDARAVLDDFATADVLVLSRSSLGYVAGLLNPHGLIIWAPWWHPPVPGWLVADAEGNLDAAEVESRIGALLRRRRQAASVLPSPA